MTKQNLSGDMKSHILTLNTKKLGPLIRSLLLGFPIRNLLSVFFLVEKMTQLRRPRKRLCRNTVIGITV
jgi:hypothetical protein